MGAAADPSIAGWNIYDAELKKPFIKPPVIRWVAFLFPQPTCIDKNFPFRQIKVAIKQIK
jgi:hypothetical protein